MGFFLARFNASGRWAANQGSQRRTALRARRSIAASRRTSWPRRRRCVQPARRRGAAQGRRSRCASPRRPTRQSGDLLCQSVRRVPLPSGSSSHRRSLPPQLYSSSLGASVRFTVVSETCGVGVPTVESFTGPHGGQVPIGVERCAFGQVRRIGQRLPHHRRRVTELSDEDERLLLSVLPYLRPAGRTRCVLLAIGHLPLVFLFVRVNGSMRSRWRSRAFA